MPYFIISHRGKYGIGNGKIKKLSESISGRPARFVRPIRPPSPPRDYENDRFRLANTGRKKRQKESSPLIRFTRKKQCIIRGQKKTASSPLDLGRRREIGRDLPLPVRGMNRTPPHRTRPVDR